VAKEDFFSKFNIKDYNNQLEEILEEKNFSEGTKNILLNILYKMENAYDDYKKVKVYTNSKKELLEEIINVIKDNCNEIEIIKPRIDKKTKLENKRYIIEKDKIITYPNEKNMFYALTHLNSNRFIINAKYDFLKESMEEMLNNGYIIDREEMIRDFDGWTWNIQSDSIENYIYNVIYQNIKILFGNQFLKNCINNKRTDILKQLKNGFQDFSKQESEKNNILELIYKISILEYIKNNNIRKEKFMKTKKCLEEEITQMNNKKDYLQKMANNKKIIGKDIKSIDEKLNNNKLLRESFVEENKNLEENKKIFSLSEYSEKLQEKRKYLLKKLNNYSEIMKPINFVKKKTEISEKYNLLKEFDFNKIDEKDTISLLVKLQKDFLKLLSNKIITTESKKEIIEFIYLVRYYKLIHINSEEQIKDIKELSEEIRKIEKQLITKACKLKIVTILSQDIEKNYELVSKILSYNIIELENIRLEFQKHDKNIVLNIYDDETIEDTIICDEGIELNVKFNKRIRLFN
jgi:hypothetical protein